MKIHRLDIRRGLLFSSLVLLLTISCVSVDVEDEDMNVPENPCESDLNLLVADLLTWIGEHSAYAVEPYLHQLPEVTFCDRDQEISYEGRNIIVHEPINGVYDKDSRKIYLVKPWSSQNLKNVSTLLHELVHYVQYSSKEWECWRKTEWEAYKLQEAWLDQHGVDAGFNWTEILMLSSCSRRDIHPQHK